MSEKSISKLMNLWNTIGPFNMELFGNRLLLQKKVFLLQEIGMDLGYHFNAYKRGPYCSTLASDGYNIGSIVEIKENLTIEMKPLDILKELSKNHEDEIYWFETLATIVYLVRKEGLKEKEILLKRFAEYKPHLASEKEMFEEAYAILEEKSLI